MKSLSSMPHHQASNRQLDLVDQAKRSIKGWNSRPDLRLAVPEATAAHASSVHAVVVNPESSPKKTLSQILPAAFLSWTHFHYS